MRRIIGIAGSLALLALVAAGSGGCGGSSFTSARSTLQGTVRTANGTAAAGVVAAVPASNLSATTDDAGRFSLEGADDGPATLQISAPGLRASIRIPALRKNLLVRVRVRLTSDGRAELEAEPEAELSGTVDSISGSDLVVSGVTVHTDAQTIFRIAGQAGALAQLKAGQEVEVEGEQQADGTVLAHKIEAEAEHAPENEVALSGKIDAIAAPDLTVAGKTVRTDARTRISISGQVKALADLAVGEQVEVEGTVQADGSIIAREIDGGNGAGAIEAIIELRGKVEAKSGSDLTISGRAIHTDAMTVVDGRGASRMSDIHVGASVEVHGVLNSDGSVRARRIHLEN